MQHDDPMELELMTKKTDSVDKTKKTIQIQILRNIYRALFAETMVSSNVLWK